MVFLKNETEIFSQLKINSKKHIFWPQKIKLLFKGQKIKPGHQISH